MIEIIEEGTKKVVKCKYCGCKFSYENEDIQSHAPSGVTVPDCIINLRRDYVSCPQCNEEYVISSTK